MWLNEISLINNIYIYMFINIILTLCLYELWGRANLVLMLYLLLVKDLCKIFKHCNIEPNYTLNSRFIDWIAAIHLLNNWPQVIICFQKIRHMLWTKIYLKADSRQNHRLLHSFCMILLKCVPMLPRINDVSHPILCAISPLVQHMSVCDELLYK